MPRNVGELRVRFGADLKAFDAALKDLSGKFGKAVSQLQREAKLMTAAVSAPIAAIGALTTKAFSDFDSAMTQSLAIMGDVSDAMRDDMAKAAQDMTRISTFSADETAKAFFFLASAGLDAEKSIAALPVVTRFAQAGMFDLSTATDLLTDAQSAMGLASQDATENLNNMARVSDVLVAANTAANATVQQFSEALTNRAASAARLVGQSLEETVATLAVFADQGVKGAEAGTRVGIVLRDLQTKALKNRREFERLGIAVFDANGQFRGIGNVLQDLEARFQGASDEQEKLTLLTLGFSDKSVGALQQLLGFSDALKEYESELKSAGGATGRVADTQLESLQSQFRQLKNNVTNLFIAIGKELRPAIEGLIAVANKGIDVLRPIVETFAELPDHIKIVIATVVALTAAIGPLTIALNFLVVAVGKLTFALRAFKVGLAALGIAGAVVAIGSLVAEFGLAAEGADELATSIERVGKAADKVKAKGALIEPDTPLTIFDINKNLAEMRKELARLQGQFEAAQAVDKFFERVRIETVQLGVRIQRLQGLIADLESRSLSALKKTLADVGQRVRKEFNLALSETAPVMEAIGKSAADLGASLHDTFGFAADDINDYGAAFTRLAGNVEAQTALIEAAVSRQKELVAELVDAAASGNDVAIFKAQQALDAFDRKNAEFIENAKMGMAEWQRVATGAYQAIGTELDQFVTLSRLALEEQTRLQAELAALTVSGTQDQIAAAEERLALFQERNAALLSENFLLWAAWAQGAQSFLTSVNEAALSLFLNFTRGFGNAVARAIVFGEDFGKAMTALFKNLAANIISNVIRIGLEWVASMIIASAASAAFHVARVGQALTEIYLNSFASAAAIPFVGFAIAPEAASTNVAIAAATAPEVFATGLALGAATSGVPGLHEGGMVTGEGLALLHPAEVVVPFDRVEDVLGGNRQMEQRITFVLDGEVLSETVARGLPDVLEIQGLGLG